MPGEDVQQAMEAFGVRLRELRQEASLTGRALAQLTGLHCTKISRAENGRQSVTDAEIRGWCAACGARDRVPGLIAMARTVESMYREWRRQTRAGMRQLQESSAPLYERSGEQACDSGTYRKAGFRCTASLLEHGGRGGTG